MFNLFKKVGKAAVKEISAEYSANKDFLEAICAGIALIAAADGDIEEAEKRSALAIVTGHPQLGKLYQHADIEQTLSAMLSRAKTGSGKQQLARELGDIKGKPNASQMAEDVYLVCLDIAHSDGEVEEAEAVVLKKIANLLGVDPSKFEF